jgi:hypothetical protein
MSTVLANADETTFFGDIDLGEMFLNYYMDRSLQPYVGVDLSDLKTTHKKRIMRWERSLMGVKSSPFNCVRLYLISEEVIKGDRHAKDNPFRWDKVVYNLPGTLTYNPHKPWLYKLDEERGVMASFVVSYVDDLRTGSQRGEEECNHVTHTMASGLNYVGEQDAARKRRPASRKPGPWAGAVMEAVPGEGLYVSTSKEKWEKMKQIIDFYYKMTLAEKSKSERHWVERKRLERDTGFLVHMFMAYENMRPYLKGFYLTLNEWRFDRDEEGWQLGKRHWKEIAASLWEDDGRWREAMEQHRLDGGKEPERVAMVSQMEKDVAFLQAMFEEEQPSRRLIRGTRIMRLIYGFGDASGAGFGSSWVEMKRIGKRKQGELEQREEHNEVKYRFGRWGSEGEGTSSNYRELRNLVDSLDEMGGKGELCGVEIFLFTDNSTAEAAFNRGSSSSPRLYELIKRVKLLEMLHKARVRVVHVGGTRMIAQGTDGLSRGCLVEGVMQGENMLAFVPLHETALQRSGNILDWLRECHGGKGDKELTVLEKEDWFWRGHDIVGGTRNVDGRWVPVYGTGQYVWAPPPCVAGQCLEELRKARHKRQHSTHVFVCPRIMTVEWQKHLYKSADLILTINPGHPIWDHSQHEPLIIGFFFPFLRYEPWQLKSSRRMVDMGGHLQRVCKEDPSALGSLLRQLWEFTRKLSDVPEHVVCKLLQGPEVAGLPQTAPRKRRRVVVEKEKRRGAIRDGQKG